jgi:hypothetical protein
MAARPQPVTKHDAVPSSSSHRRIIQYRRWVTRGSACLDTRITLVNGVASSRIRKIAPELRRPKRTDPKSECAPRLPGNGIEGCYGAKLYAASSRIFKQYRNLGICVAERDPGGARDGDDEGAGGGCEGQPKCKIKPSPAGERCPIARTAG